jgi:hypothetical protein
MKLFSTVPPAEAKAVALADGPSSGFILKAMLIGGPQDEAPHARLPGWDKAAGAAVQIIPAPVVRDGGSAHASPASGIGIGPDRNWPALAARTMPGSSLTGTED